MASSSPPPVPEKDHPEQRSPSSSSIHSYSQVSRTPSSTHTELPTIFSGSGSDASGRTPTVERSNPLGGGSSGSFSGYTMAMYSGEVQTPRDPHAHHSFAMSSISHPASLGSSSSSRTAKEDVQPYVMGSMMATTTEEQEGGPEGRRKRLTNPPMNLVADDRTTQANAYPNPQDDTPSRSYPWYGDARQTTPDPHDDRRSSLGDRTLSSPSSQIDPLSASASGRQSIFDGFDSPRASGFGGSSRASLDSTHSAEMSLRGRESGAAAPDISSGRLQQQAQSSPSPSAQTGSIRIPHSRDGHGRRRTVEFGTIQAPPFRSASSTSSSSVSHSQTESSHLNEHARATQGDRQAQSGLDAAVGSSGRHSQPQRSQTLLTTVTGSSFATDASLPSSYNSRSGSLQPDVDNNPSLPRLADPVQTGPDADDVVHPRENPFDALAAGGQLYSVGSSSTHTTHHHRSPSGSDRNRFDVRNTNEQDDDGEDNGSEDDDENENYLHPPIFTRSLSAPLPSRIKHFKHPNPSNQSPRRSSTTRSNAQSVHPLSQVSSSGDIPGLSHSETITPSSAGGSLNTPNPIQTLSLELADNLQSAIQTLLHLSPPHLLDSAKEQYSSCTVQLPTTSISALLTAMKSLNYLSANSQALMNDLEPTHSNSQLTPTASSGRLSTSNPAGAAQDQATFTSTHAEQSKGIASDSNANFSAGGGGSDGRTRSSTVASDLFSAVTAPAKLLDDFDIGELLQSAADQMGGLASQSGVDMVLFHSNVGIKHVTVKGDGEGLAYALSHVLRQIISVCQWGDVLELGLNVSPLSSTSEYTLDHPFSSLEMAPSRSNDGNAAEESGPVPGKVSRLNSDVREGVAQGRQYLVCTFEIVHNLIASPFRLDGSKTMASELDEEPRRQPDLSGVLGRRLLKHVGAVLKIDQRTTEPATSTTLPGSKRSYSLSVVLPRGDDNGRESQLTAEEEAARQPFPSLRLAREPTLDELSAFAEGLRGRKVDLHASLRSVFARHLTSYLAAWGMDISHFATEEAENFTSGLVNNGINATSELPDDGAQIKSFDTQQSKDPSDEKKERIVIIDDDVDALKKQLLRLRAEICLPNLRNKRLARPSLSQRARSSPHIRSPSQLQSFGPATTPVASQAVLIHFTSLANYNHVRDIVSSILNLSVGFPGFRPEVLVVPKPVGPRRFLTALHTALSRPVIDPYFTPIATSPRSPGGSYFSPPQTSRMPSVLEHPLKSSGDARESGSERDSVGEAVRTPFAEPRGESHANPTTEGSADGPVAATPAFEYFSAAMQGSGPSGVVVQSPDGRPVGMYFEPPARTERRGSASARGAADMQRRRSIAHSSVSTVATVRQGDERPSPSQRRQPGFNPTNSRSHRDSVSFKTIEDEDEPENDGYLQAGSEAKIHNDSEASLSGRSLGGTKRDRSSTVTYGRNRNGSVEKGDEDDWALSPSQGPRPGLASLRAASKRSVLQAAKADAQARAAKRLETSSQSEPTKKATPNKETLVVPPINVLIVEDNPINQNILSMFLRKRKLKHQAANNGLEAIEKWKSGTFHLILMDIQLPVMDGIEATKEIRRLEKSNNIGIFPSTPTHEGGGRNGLSPAAEEPPGTPLRSSVIIVALTASSLQSDRVTALAAGCNDFLTKPVSLKWLENKIVEWGCMQALIDFEGWRRWKSVDAKNNSNKFKDAKRNMQDSSEAKARLIANRLRIAPQKGNTARDKGLPDPPPPTVHRSSNKEIISGGPTPAVTEPEAATKSKEDTDLEHSTLPENANDTVGKSLPGLTGAQALQQGLSVAKDALQRQSSDKSKQDEGSASTPVPSASLATPQGQLVQQFAYLTTADESRSNTHQSSSPESGLRTPASPTNDQSKPAQPRKLSSAGRTSNSPPDREGESVSIDSMDAQGTLTAEPGPKIMPNPAFEEGGGADSGPLPSSNPSSEQTADSSAGHRSGSSVSSKTPSTTGSKLPAHLYINDTNRSESDGEAHQVEKPLPPLPEEPKHPQ